MIIIHFYKHPQFVELNDDEQIKIIENISEKIITSNEELLGKISDLIADRYR